MEHGRYNNIWKIMHEQVKKIFVFILCVLAITNTCIPAGAYVLSGPHLLELMTEKLGAPKRLFVAQQIIMFNQIQDILSG